HAAVALDFPAARRPSPEGAAPADMIASGASSRMRDLASALALVNRRFRFLIGLMLLVICLLGVRLGLLQLGDHEQYAARAEDNRLGLRALAPNRGLIMDRRGRVLAENRPAYRLTVVPERAEDLELTLARLADLVPVSDDERRRFARQRSRSR